MPQKLSRNSSRGRRISYDNEPKIPPETASWNRLVLFSGKTQGISSEKHPRLLPRHPPEIFHGNHLGFSQGISPENIPRTLLRFLPGIPFEFDPAIPPRIVSRIPPRFIRKFFKKLLQKNSGIHLDVSTEKFPGNCFKNSP